MVREVSLETLPNVNICYPSHDKNLRIIKLCFGSHIMSYFDLGLFDCTIQRD